MKNILFMLLAFLCLPSWGADEPKKLTKIDLAGGWINGYTAHKDLWT